MGFDGKVIPPPFLNGGGFKMVDGHTFCRMSAVDIQLCGCGFFFLFLIVNFQQKEC